jgi:hypothetical protein
MMHLRSAALLVLVLALPWALHAQAISMGGANDDVPRLEFGANTTTSTRMRLQANAVAFRSMEAAGQWSTT